MTVDEQRKRIYELECALGKAIKLAEEGIEEKRYSLKVNQKMSEMIATLSTGIQTYLATMDKRHLLNAVNMVAEHAKTLKTPRI